MVNNIAINKQATSSSYVSPYAPSRAVDGSLVPVNRWLSNTVPCWLMIDAGKIYWTDHWVVWQMPVAGWDSPDYLNSTLELHASTDNSNWVKADSVSGSQSSSIIDRTFTPVQGRFFRVYISNGLKINPQLASITEFALYEAPSKYLSGLVLSSGTLIPAFNKMTFSYTASVDYDTDFVTVTPTAEDPAATITVNGDEVASGHASPPIPLDAGTATEIIITVTPTSGAPQNYVVEVTRQASAYLSDLVVKRGPSTVTLTPAFSPTELGPYTASVTSSSIKIVPTTEDPSATVVVTCNGTELTKSGTYYPATLNSGDNSIVIKVTSTTGDEKSYTLTITKT